MTERFSVEVREKDELTGAYLWTRFAYQMTDDGEITCERAELPKLWMNGNFGIQLEPGVIGSEKLMFVANVPHDDDHPKQIEFKSKTGLIQEIHQIAVRLAEKSEQNFDARRWDIEDAIALETESYEKQVTRYRREIEIITLHEQRLKEQK
jgi:hypothetical protein